MLAFALTLATSRTRGRERQKFRVRLPNDLSLQFPSSEADAKLTTASLAIELAQKNIVTAFIRHKAAAN
jgi:hypothetical protein